MKRNLTGFGLAFGLVLALGAFGASGASAQQGVVTTGGEEVALMGTETGEEANRLTAFGAFVECPGSFYTGHKVDETPHALIPDAQTEVTLTPFYNQTDAEGNLNCVGPFSWSATIRRNGCDYNATLGETIADHEYDVAFAVACPEEEAIEVTLWTNVTEHESKPTEPFCAIDIGSQSNLTGARAIDTETNDGHIELVGEVTGIAATKTALTPGHSFLCAQHETTAIAKFHLDATVSAHDDVGGPVPIKLSH